MGARPFMGLFLLIGVLLLTAVACTSEEAPASTSTTVHTETQSSTPLAHTSTPLPTPTSAPTPVPGPLLPSVADIVEKVKPSVVSIVVEVPMRTCEIFFGCRIQTQRASGTGVIFDSKGYIVTNNHVVEGADKTVVTLGDGRSFEAELVGRDPASDLAVIRIPDENYTALGFADPEKIRVGDWVITIGNALALPGGPTVTMGIVGALDRVVDTEGARLTDMIQTDAAINPGNSGGPLLNLDGEVVGINTAKTHGGEGIGFSVNTFTVVPVVESILKHGRVIFAWLGIGVDDMTPVIAAQQGLSVKRGVLVLSVTPWGPAEKAGILVGDVIVAFDGTEVENVKRLQIGVRRYKIGDEGEVTVVRGKETRNFRVTLEEQPRGL